MGKKLHGNFILFLLFLPILTWGQCPTSVSISADTGSTICEGTTVEFTANIPAGSYGTLSYDWKIGTTSVGSSSTFTTSNLNNTDEVQLTINSFESDGTTPCSISSNILKMTVNTNRTGSVSIQANNTNICPGDNVNFSIASSANLGSSPIYEWRLTRGTSTTSVGSNSTYSSTTLQSGDQIQLYVESNIPCTTPTPVISNSIPITLKAGTPVQPGTLTVGDSDPFCPGVAKTYSVPNDPSATEYIWTLPSGWTGSSNTNSISVTTGTSSGNITVAAKNDCGTSSPRILAVNAAAEIPNTPGTITGDIAVCPGIAKTYSITAVPNASQYIWTLPGGWNGGTTSVTTTSPTLNVTSGATGNNGNISVVARNSCGSSSARTLDVTVKAGTPAAPSGINGSTAICPGLSEQYSITPVSGATQYIWTLPPGFSAPSLTTTNPQINVTASASGSGQITVRASNDCGSSAAVSSSTITISKPAPVMTGAISGPTGVCANTSGHIYTLPAITNATSYTWTATSGLSITAGQGTNSITVSAGSSAGSLSVVATNSCGTSAAQSLTVNLNNPAPVMTGGISGPTSVCSGGTALTYSIPAIPNATSYNWTFPGTGWNITSGGGTRSITVTPGSASGNISVTATNSCGTSTSTTIAVASTTGIPNQPGQITTNLTTSKICPVLENLTFEIPGQAGLSYLWTLPTGFEITAGAGTRKITVRVNANTTYASNLKVEVQAVNACGNSSKRIYEPISVDNYVLADLGPDLTVCSSTSTITIPVSVQFGNGSGKLRVASITSTGTNPVQGIPTGNTNSFNATYTPSQTDLNAGQVTFTLTTEKPAGACQAGTDQMTVFFKPVPAVNITSNSPICAGNTTTINFSGTPNTRVTYRIGSSTTDQFINLDNTGNASLTTATLNANTTYNLRSIQYQDTPICSTTVSGSTTVTVTQPPTATISYNSPFCTTITSPQAVNLSGTNAYTGGTFNQPAGLNINSSGAITPSASSPGTYTVTYTTPASGNCPAVVTSTEVKIQAETIITSEPIDTRACTGDGVSFNVVASGEDLTYQWYFNSVTNGNEVAGGNSATLNLTSITPAMAGDYYVVVNNTASCGAVTSSPAELTVDQEILIETQPVDLTTCEGSTSGLNVVATTGGNPLDGTFTYQWYKGEPGSGTSLPGRNAPDLTFNPALPEDSANYYVEITGSLDYTCQSVTSNVATYVVRPTPTVEISGDTSICEGESADITFFNGTPNTTVNFTINGDNNNPLSITLDSEGNGVYDSGSLFATSNTDTDFVYSLSSVAYPDTPDCSNSVNGLVTITVIPNPDATISFADDQVEFCTADTNAYTPILSGTGNYAGGSFSANGLSIDPNDGTFTPSANPSGDYTITYTIPEYGGCAEEVVTLDISIYEEVLITSEPFNVGICSTQNAEFSVAASGDNLTYQWYKDGNPINGATSATLSLPVATSSDAGDYYVMIAGTNACTPTESSQVQSETVTLNVDEDIVIIEPAEDVRVCNDTNATVEFKFVVHANGAPLLFEWIYADGTPVKPDTKANMVATLTQRPPTSEEISNNPELAGLQVYEGMLTISNITSADQASYAVRIDGSANNFNCPEAISNSFDLDVDPLPNPPESEDVVYCVGDTAVELSATGVAGSTLFWYESTTDPNPSETPPTPDTSVAGTTSYYVTQMDSEGFCESEMKEIVVTVNPLPNAPPISTEETNVSYCVGDTATALTATADAGSNINWYGPGDQDLALAEAPTPQTTAKGDLFYWVSQTNENGCEGPKTQITVTISDLPIITITNAGDDIICQGESVILTATDSNQNGSNTNFSWTSSEDPGNPLNGASQTFSPQVTTTYTVTATNNNSCVNIAEYTINVDTPPIAGELEGPDAVCETDPSGSLDLTGFTGTVMQWEFKAEGDTEWTVIEETTPDANFMFTGITKPTSYRVLVGNGVCAGEYSNEVAVNIDLVPEGGELLWQKNGERLFLTCENPAPGYGSQLNLTGNVGNIIHWEYRGLSATNWQVIDNQTNSIDPSQIESVVLNETTAFRVRIEGNSCGPDVYSATALMSVIEADIKPTPVEVDKDVICIGDTITLSSETGYSSNGGKFDGGAFDNAALDNSNTWVFEDADGTVYNFESSANNGRANHWLRMNPHGNTEPNEKVYTAELYPIDEQGPGNGYMVNFRTFSSNAGNKGFALVTGNNDSNFETPIFSLGGLDEAILTWDQAYNLTEGAKITVEISTNGGGSYNTVLFDTIGTATSGNYDNFGDLTPAQRPLNKMVVDLGAYIGMSNLRLRWRYEGTIDGDVWAVDNIQVPEGPQDILLQWYYDDDLNDPDNYLEPIGAVNQGTVTFEPRKIGWNDFEVQTRIILDSNGDQCQSIDNFETIRVWAFDRYTTDVTATVGACGSLAVQLDATVFATYQNKNITEYPTLDGYEGSWQVEDLNGNIVSSDEFTLSNQDPNDTTTDPLENPNAIFTAENLGNYNFKWILTPTAVDENNELIDNSGCPPVENPANVTLVDCTTLDFDGEDDYIDLGQTEYAGNYFIEAWIRPFNRTIDGGGNTDASTGTIISGPNFEIKMEDLPIGTNDRWYHIAVSNNGSVWVDGVPTTATANGTGGSRTLIGARWSNSNKAPENHFSGWIEEVRIWKNAPDLKELRFMMNQRIKLDATATANTLIEGEIVPNLDNGDGFSSYYTDGPHNLDQDGDRFYDQTWGDLAGYYRLISDNPDPANLIECATFDDSLKPIGGYTPDHSTSKVPGRLVNITTNQENTSPTPYCSGANATWADRTTWARPTVWDYPNSSFGGTALNWNIARVNHNITSDSKEIIMLGLLSETPGSLLSINGDHAIRITHYLLLNGNMDLIDDSQLLQDHGSILDNSSSGWAEIDQQGRKSSFNYNYWTSPFTNRAANNNSGFTIENILFDGSNTNIEEPAINFAAGYFSADGGITSPITISNEWIWDFRGGDADIYGDWLHLGSDYLEIVGAGYSMKGTTGSAGLDEKQNYTFRGKPNNGNIPLDELYLQNDQNYLVGNPYPSAIDADKFLKDNLVNVGTGTGNNENGENVFNGTLYFWDHFAGFTHILAEYVGGYATYTLSGSAPAISNDWRINSGGGSNTIHPQQFIPVAQGFFLNSAPVVGQNFGGDIIFKNTQRVFQPKDANFSIFLQQEEDFIKEQESSKSPEDTRMKIRVKFESPKGYYRQILVTRDENTSNGFDIGYDAPLIENNLEDMYWWFEDHGFVIQGVPDFEKEQVLPLAIKTKEGGEFKIKIDATENWPTGKELYLKDKTIDTIHDILKEDYIGKIEDTGEITDRFELVFFKEKAEAPVIDPDDIIDPNLPILDGIVGISYSRFDKQVKISNFDLLEVDKVMIFDLGGKLIQEFDELPTEKEIRLGMRPVRSGVYIVKVYCENGICNKKIIIE